MVTCTTLHLIDEEHPGAEDAQAAPAGIARWRAEDAARHRRQNKSAKAGGPSTARTSEDAWETAMSSSFRSALSSMPSTPSVGAPDAGRTPRASPVRSAPPFTPQPDGRTAASSLRSSGAVPGWPVSPWSDPLNELSVGGANVHGAPVAAPHAGRGQVQADLQAATPFLHARGGAGGSAPDSALPASHAARGNACAAEHSEQASSLGSPAHPRAGGVAPDDSFHSVAGSSHSTASGFTAQESFTSARSLSTQETFRSATSFRAHESLGSSLGAPTRTHSPRRGGGAPGSRITRPPRLDVAALRTGTSPSADMDGGGGGGGGYSPVGSQQAAPPVAVPPRSACVAFVAEVRSVSVDVDPRSGHTRASVVALALYRAQPGQRGAYSGAHSVTAANAATSAGSVQFQVDDVAAAPAWREVAVHEPPLVHRDCAHDAPRGSTVTRGLERSGSMPFRASELVRPGRAAATELSNVLLPAGGGGGRRRSVQLQRGRSGGLRASASQSQLALRAAPRASVDARRARDLLAPPQPPIISMTSGVDQQATRIVVQPLRIRADAALLEYSASFERSVVVATAAPEPQVPSADLSALPVGPARAMAAAEVALGAALSHSLHVTLEGVAVCVDADGRGDGCPQCIWLQARSVTLLKRAAASAADVAVAVDDAQVVSDREAGGWVPAAGVAAAQRGKGDLAVTTAAARWLGPSAQGADDTRAVLNDLMLQSLAVSADSLWLAVVDAPAAPVARLPAPAAQAPLATDAQVDLGGVHAALRVPAAPFAPRQADVSIERAAIRGAASDQARRAVLTAWFDALSASRRVKDAARAPAAARGDDVPPIAALQPCTKLRIAALEVHFARDDVAHAPSVSASVQALSVDTHANDMPPRAFGEVPPPLRACTSPQLCIAADCGAVAIACTAPPITLAPGALVFLPDSLRRLGAASLAIRASTRLSDSKLSALTADVHAFTLDALCAGDAGAAPALWRLVRNSTPDRPGVFRIQMAPADPGSLYMQTTVLLQDMCWAGAVVAHLGATVAEALLPSSDDAGPTPEQQQPADAFTAATIALRRCSIFAAAPHVPPTPAAGACAPPPHAALAAALPPRPLHAAFTQQHPFESPPELSAASAADGDPGSARGCVGIVPAVELAFEEVLLVLPDCGLETLLHHPYTLERVLKEAFAALQPERTGSAIAAERGDAAPALADAPAVPHVHEPNGALPF